jgi:uncharacterized protein (DUF2141 family)
MNKLFGFILVAGFALTTYSFSGVNDKNSASITIKVTDLQNSNGVVQFSLYNHDGTIPDEHFEKYYRQLKAKVSNQTATITFNNLPKGTYAINILHDENDDGVIEKGIMLPVEGLGFSNFIALNIFNRPNYKKAKFELKSDTTITIPVIYM